MKKHILRVLLLLSMLMMGVLLPSDSVCAETYTPTRVINVVYDDSGSMISTNGEKVDTWCQAKYSMEVFAAMLGEKDTMNIYVMSDYSKNRYAESPKLVLSGKDGASINVEKVHNMLTKAEDTPFETVKKAYSDLITVTADEKWLVILTDGAFEDGAFSNEQVDDYFAIKDSGVKVLFLGMGDSAAAITNKPEQNIYFEKAETNDQILNKITEICTRIFNTDKLLASVATGQVSFDVPMSELTVFAQGGNISIDNIVSPAGEVIRYANAPVGVHYQTVATTPDGYSIHKDPLVDTNLVGSIVTFHGDFDPGTYTVNVTGAETLEIYYKPNVEIMAYLVDESGEEVAYTEGVRAGEYRLKFGFVKAGTEERVAESSLLGDVQYSANVRFNNEDLGKEYTQGEKISIEEGVYEISAIANYLKYNTVSAQMNFEVYRDKEFLFTVEASPEYQIDKEGFLNAQEPIVVKVTLEGEELSSEEWAEMETLTVAQSSHIDRRMDLTAVKSEEPGIFYLYPSLAEQKTTIGDYNNFDYKMSLEYRNGKEVWYGESEETMAVTDLRPWFYKHIDKVIKLAVLAAIVFVLLGYTPMFKKYLPKKLKKVPTVNCESKHGHKKAWQDRGKYTKKRWTTFIPYKAETGTIRFLPKGVSEAPKLMIKACGSNKFEIVNTKAYIKKQNVTFDGIAVPTTQKKNLQKTAGCKVKVETSATDYSCVLNQ